MGISSRLRYSRDHVWVLAKGDSARVGITIQAQDALGEIVFAGLPQVGDLLLTDQPLGELESSKSVSEIYCPIRGRVSAVNESLRGNPSLINSDPMGEGWICELSDIDPADFERLLDEAEYHALIGE